MEVNLDLSALRLEFTNSGRLFTCEFCSSVSFSVIYVRENAVRGVLERQHSRADRQETERNGP
jgi:hypothetical protein